MDGAEVVGVFNDEVDGLGCSLRGFECEGKNRSGEGAAVDGDDLLCGAEAGFEGRGVEEDV